ncbi:MAG: hypothetical protein Q9223_004844 [Gallowayella weberi]
MFVYLSWMVILCRLVLTAPPQPVSSTLFNPSSSLSINLKTVRSISDGQPRQPIGARNSIPGNSHDGVLSTPSRNRTRIRDYVVTWPVTDTLFLVITVGLWPLDPDLVLGNLAAADKTIGKRPAMQLLDRKFVQETGGGINPLRFEIEPAFTDPKHLTWTDVGEVLGEKGLPQFYAERKFWVNTYFDVVDSRRGTLGHGAVRRKWFQRVRPGDKKS